MRYLPNIFSHSFETFGKFLFCCICSGQPARVLSDTISKDRKNVSKSKARRPKSAAATAVGEMSRDEAPFAQYGMGDDELVTGNKRTYNIHAPHGVSHFVSNIKSLLVHAEA